MINEEDIVKAGVPTPEMAKGMNSMSLTDLMGMGRQFFAGPAPLEGTPEAIGVAVPVDPA